MMWDAFDELAAGPALGVAALVYLSVFALGGLVLLMGAIARRLR